MPLIAFECQDCGEIYDELIMSHKETITDKTECDTCGGKMKRAICAPSIRFKGNGFYITDNE